MTEKVAKPMMREFSHSAVVPGDRVIRSAEVARVGGRPVSHDDAPLIELVTEANAIRAIDVTCACGQKIRIWCSYETDDQQTAANR